MSVTAPVCGWSAPWVIGLCDAGVTPRVIRTILDRWVTPDEFMAATEPQRRAAGVGPFDLVAGTVPDGVWAVALGEPAYPGALAATSAPPPVLYGIGDRAALTTGVAVVGSRNMSAAAGRVACTAAAAATSIGVPVISGGAGGVDTAAHRAALDAGGVTVAVIADPVDGPHSPQRQALFDEIVEASGAVVSEHRTKPAHHGSALMARNRIIVGMASVVVVAAAEVRSGSMASALAALDADRALLVAPPSNSDGCGADGVALLADPHGADPDTIGATGRVAAKVRSRAPVANGVAATPRQLTELIEVSHLMRACP